MPEGKAKGTKIGIEVVRGPYHRDGNFRDRSPAKRGRGPYENPATGKEMVNRPGIENPIK